MNYFADCRLALILRLLFQVILLLTQLEHKYITVSTRRFFFTSFNVGIRGYFANPIMSGFSIILS